MPIVFNYHNVDPSWQACLQKALATMDSHYLNHLYSNQDWLPGPEKIFNAFSLPLHKVKYVLFGESPYPRKQSANGYAFWDAAVQDIWSESGLAKSVNRATSLRNIMKMLLVSEGALSPYQTSQSDIAQINKHSFVNNNHQFFQNLLQHGFLLLNASLALQTTPVRLDAKAWQPFLKYVLQYLIQHNPTVEFILLGSIALEINKLIENPDIKKICAEHPYNVSFIHNPVILNFFQPLHLLIDSQTA
ncbi:MAG: uracil-DNA glycosylase [Gammaproteobacteria bacterium]|nr:uracil-DNA glycosylase [Gammaproteobacteria bacterium]